MTIIIVIIIIILAKLTDLYWNSHRRAGQDSSLYIPVQVEVPGTPDHHDHDVDEDHHHNYDYDYDYDDGHSSPSRSP